MSDVEHQLHFYSPTGDLLTILGDAGISGLVYGAKDMEPGVLELLLPGDFDFSLIPIDGQIEVYQSVEGGAMKLDPSETAYFIRRRQIGVGEDGSEFVFVRAYSALGLMARRDVAYFAGASYTDKVSIAWDNLLRELIRENYGSLAVDPETLAPDASRNLSPWLTVESNQNWGTAYTRSMSWRVILNTLKDIVNDVRSQGTYCTFDIVRTSPAHYEFRVFLGPRGTDHRAGTALPVIVSRERGNLQNPLLDENWEDEKNFIYATGQGKNEKRVLKKASDAARIGISPFNRWEMIQDARNAELPDSVQAEANTALEANRPKRIFTGTLTQTEDCIYGLHWKWGDAVTVEFAGLTIDCYVDAITVSIDANGTKHAEGQLRSVSDV